MSPRHPCAHNLDGHMTFRGGGLRRRRPPSGVGAPRTTALRAAVPNYGYAREAPPGMGAGGVRNETRQTWAELP